MCSSHWRRGCRYAARSSAKRIVTVGIPVQSFAGPVEDSIHRLSRRGSRGEEQRTRRAASSPVSGVRIRLPSRASTRTWLPCSWKGCCQPPCPDHPQQHQLARMHMRVAVVRLVRILRRVVGIHVVRHRAPVDHEVSGKVGLGRDADDAARVLPCRAAARCSCLRPGGESGIHFGKLEQILAVVAGCGVVVRRTSPGESPLQLEMARTSRFGASGIVRGIADG